MQLAAAFCRISLGIQPPYVKSNAHAERFTRDLEACRLRRKVIGPFGLRVSTHNFANNPQLPLLSINLS